MRGKEIEGERARRNAAETTDVVVRVNAQVDGFISEARFGSALALIDKEATAFPRAELAPVRSKVQQALRSRWEADKTYAVNNYQRSTAASTVDSQRAGAKAEAVKRLEFVVDRYGDQAIETAAIVREARRC